ncbi:hypothetical protein [Leisingera caerulea]|nr:hypothetical protein [Leisingera caerulea]
MLFIAVMIGSIVGTYPGKRVEVSRETFRRRVIALERARHEKG